MHAKKHNNLYNIGVKFLSTFKNMRTHYPKEKDLVLLRHIEGVLGEYIF